MKQDPTRDPASEARDDWASERMTDREIALAKQAAARLLRDRAPGLSETDKWLLRKYPKHTLEQAREIEATGPQMPTDHRIQSIGFVSGFEQIVAQERGNYHLGGDHT
jgi:hypothetical protein